MSCTQINLCPAECNPVQDFTREYLLHKASEILENVVDGNYIRITVTACDNKPYDLLYRKYIDGKICVEAYEYRMGFTCEYPTYIFNDKDF